MTTAIIEIPLGSYYKYEQNKSYPGQLKLDRVLPIPCPYNYGYIPNTLSEDGDPLDVFVVSAYPIEPMVEVKLVPWGILICEDNGVEDNKVIAQLEGDLFRDYDYYRNIKFYLENYKKGFVIKEYKIINEKFPLESFIK